MDYAVRLVISICIILCGAMSHKLMYDNLMDLQQMPQQAALTTLIFSDLLFALALVVTWESRNDYQPPTA
jgi:hypothetical protein